MGYAEGVGQALQECLEQRKKHGHRLSKITLKNCPRLPASCLERLQQLDTTVVC